MSEIRANKGRPVIGARLAIGKRGCQSAKPVMASVNSSPPSPAPPAVPPAQARMIVIAVDGPAARGKGTILQRFKDGGLSGARVFVKKEGLTWLDSAGRTFTLEWNELKEWVGEGKNVEEFSKNYDSTTILNIGVIGRYFQFISIIWLSIHLYKLRKIKIWCPIINTIFSLLGIVSATLVYITQFPFPKGFEFLMLFFIPGIPFLLLYWLGVALLTNFKKSEITI